jgi:predicted RNA-binding protein with TRAM domain
MELSDPLCLFTARVERCDGEYVITIPAHEVDLGTIAAEGSCRVGMYPTVAQSATMDTSASARTDAAMSGRATQNGSQSSSPRRTRTTLSAHPETPSGSPRNADGPPVSEGETRRLEIEDVGDQGDGLARVGPGYVVFVSDADVGDEPLVRITTVRENVAFADVVEE